VKESVQFWNLDVDAELCYGIILAKGQSLLRYEDYLMSTKGIMVVDSDQLVNMTEKGMINGAWSNKDLNK
jgi:hypothetical protein